MDIKIIRVPIIVVIINFLVFALVPGNLTGSVGDVIYNVIRLSMVTYAGWLAVRKGHGTLRTAALVGLLLFAFEHIVLKGGKYLLDTYFYNEPLQRGVDAFLGVVISFAMWFMLPVVMALIGGLIAERTKPR